MKLKTVIRLLVAGRASPLPADSEDIQTGVVSYYARSGRLVGITTCIDESSVYPADLSSPFFEEPKLNSYADMPGEEGQETSE